MGNNHGYQNKNKKKQSNSRNKNSKTGKASKEASEQKAKPAMIYRKLSWNLHGKPETCNIQNKLVCIDDSIWYSTLYNHGEKGMVEYDLKIAGGRKEIVKYTDDIVHLQYHSVCKFQNLIYIVDGLKGGGIIEFNPATHKFTKKLVKMEEIGANPSLLISGDYIHIYNGNRNDKEIALIYDPINDKIETIKDEFAAEEISDGYSVKYKDRLIRFGGYNGCERKDIDDFWFTAEIDIVYGFVHVNAANEVPLDIVKLIHEFFCDPQQHIWTRFDNFKMIKPLKRCGYILYEDFILTFGGYVGRGEWIDNIYILDIRDKDKGWIEIDAKCPEKSEYRAVLTENNDVHLFGASQECHYSIHLSKILPNLYIEL